MKKAIWNIKKHLNSLTDQNRKKWNYIPIETEF
jgi:hypothetical protein